MRGERTYFVYIMTNRSRTLYTDITNHLERRVLEHKDGLMTSPLDTSSIGWFISNGSATFAGHCEGETNQRVDPGPEDSIDRVCESHMA